MPNIIMNVILMHLYLPKVLFGKNIHQLLLGGYAVGVVIKKIFLLKLIGLLMLRRGGIFLIWEMLKESYLKLIHHVIGMMNGFQVFLSNQIIQRTALRILMVNL